MPRERAQEISMRDYVIQEYQEGDVDEMIALGAEMHREGAYNYLPYNPEKLRQLDRDIRAGNRAFGNGWIARYEGRIIGIYVAFINYYFFCDVKMGSDYFLYVGKQYRNKFPMMPVRLIKRAEQWAKQNGAKEFSPATSVMISPGVENLYKFMKYDVVGHLFKKKLK
jgi:hypothetical protein